jgi:hypothetical protein
MFMMQATAVATACSGACMEPDLHPLGLRGMHLRHNPLLLSFADEVGDIVQAG